MLGMMNCNSDSVEFYSAPTSKSGGSTDEETKIFVEHKERKKISYTEGMLEDGSFPFLFTVFQKGVFRWSKND